jgi:two-component system, cell cycle sensor histidine kinase and response regulator CckA
VVQGPTASVVTNLAYPFGDLMLIGLVVGALAMRGWRVDRRAGLLALGMAAFWVADSVFLAHPTSAETPLDVGWALAPVLAAWAAWQAPPLLPADDSSSAAVGLPLGFAGLSLAMLFAAGLVTVTPLAVALAAASQLAVLGRLVLTFREHRAAVAAERRAQAEQRRLQERLERSQRLETVGQLAGGVAHDFNNLLAVVLNCVDLVRDAVVEGDSAHDDLDAIESAAHRGARLTRQLLLFGQRNAVSAEILDVAEVVSATCAMLARTLGEHVALGWSSGAATWRAEVDRGNIEQVVANLVLNARDAVGPGGTITVTTGNERLDRARAAELDVAVGPYIRLTVTDDGCGMPPELLARVFEPFVTTKPPGVGTGLGLATVYGVVRQAGGGVRVESEAGRGTTFEVYLPAALTLPAAEPMPPPQLAGGGTGQRVLIVEDEPPLRDLLERIVARAGYAVDTAASGEEALRRPGPYDLVVTDMVMPGMTGHELAQRLRGADPGQRMLFVSGYSPDLLERHGASVPAPLLLKPFTAEALLRHVGEALGG